MKTKNTKYKKQKTPKLTAHPLYSGGMLMMCDQNMPYIIHLKKNIYVMYYV